MKFYIKEKAFSLNSKFNITDEDNLPVYRVEGRLFSWPKKFTLYSSSGKGLLTIEQEFSWFLTKFNIMRAGQVIATIKEEFTWFKPNYSVDLKGWEIRGDFWGHDYEIMKANNRVASISKKVLSWSDIYEIDVRKEEDIELILAIVIVIDANIDNKRANQNA